MRSLAALLTILPGLASAQIYCDFETSAGRFSIELDHVQSPQAAANFIRLAEGTTAWADPETGLVHAGIPFFDGLNFYSATPNDGSTPNPGIAFGSQTGNGDDDPGYVFQDDDRALGVPTRCAYMENRDPDGDTVPNLSSDPLPNANGSRIFIALSQLPVEVQTHYTFLGEIKAATNPPGGDGFATVDTISMLPADTVTINSVSIRRNGISANNFDEHDQGLAEVEAAKLDISRHNDGLVLDWENNASSTCRFWQSSDLSSWPDRFEVVNYPGKPVTGYALDAAFIAANPRAFFRGARVAYSNWPSTMRPLNLAIIQATFRDQSEGPTFPSNTFQFHFNSAGDGGSWNELPPSSAAGIFTVIEYTPTGPFTSTLTVQSATLPTYQFLLHYDRNALGLTKQVSRMGGWNLSTPQPNNELFEGTWNYLPEP